MCKLLHGHELPVVTTESFQLRVIVFVRQQQTVCSA